MPRVESTDDLYRIGTVAKLTGIAVERLRAWERRYGLEPVHRAGKTRFYNAAQVSKLQQMKRLLDQGHAISSLVNLSTEQLDERYNRTQPTGAPLARPSKVGLVGPNLLVLEQQQGSDSELDVQARWDNLSSYLAEEPASGGAIHAPLDLLFVQAPVFLAEEILDLQAQNPDTQVIAVYQFATEANLAEAKDNDLDVLHWPLTWRDLEQLAATANGTPLRAARTAPRRYSDAELIAIAASSSDATNCPNHLVELISQLNAFADYTLSLAEEEPAANLYERIHTDTTQARAQLELALDLATNENVHVLPFQSQ